MILSKMSGELSWHCQKCQRKSHDIIKNVRETLMLVLEISEKFS